jgi:hypothetical protein
MILHEVHTKKFVEMEYSSSWEANSVSYDQKVQLLWDGTRKAHYRVHKNP